MAYININNQQYSMTNVAPSKPYLQVKSSYIPLTTNTQKGKPTVKGTKGTYRVMQYTNTTKEQQSTSAQPGNMSRTTALTSSYSTMSVTSTTAAYSMSKGTSTGVISDIYHAGQQSTFHVFSIMRDPGTRLGYLTFTASHSNASTSGTNGAFAISRYNPDAISLTVVRTFNRETMMAMGGAQWGDSGLFATYPEQTSITGVIRTHMSGSYITYSLPAEMFITTCGYTRQAKTRTTSWRPMSTMTATYSTLTRDTVTDATYSIPDGPSKATTATVTSGYKGYTSVATKSFT